MSRVVTVFRARLRADVPEDYWVLAGELEALARQVDGFVEYKVFTAPDGERVSLAIFESAAAEAEWRDHVAHRQAQQRGRDAFYDEYDVSVCEVTRRRSWARTPSSDAPMRE